MSEKVQTKEHISIRLTNNQHLVLRELSTALDTSISMVVRAVVGSWLKENEEYVYKIIDRKRLEKDPNYKIPEENNFNIFEE